MLVFYEDDAFEKCRRGVRSVLLRLVLPSALSNWHSACDSSCVIDFWVLTSAWR